MNKVEVQLGWNNYWEVRVNRVLIAKFWRKHKAEAMAFTLLRALENVAPVVPQ